MNINGAFPSAYLKAADLGGQRRAVTIDRVAMETIGDEHKPVVYFEGKDKGLVLNKTNASMIVEITGAEETDQWSGTAIVLYPTKTDFQGKRVDAIRIDYPQKKTAAKKVAPAPPVEEIEDDPIPF